MSRPAVTTAHLIGEISGYRGGAIGADHGFLRLSAGAGTTSATKTFIDLSGYSTVSDMDRNIVLGTSGIEQMRINSNGNLLIGKTTQANPVYKLDVKGKTRADEIVVNTSGADFVFDKQYVLPKLSDVKAYIGQNHHLSEIPSAKEMQTNGLELGEMNKKLLQKVEELTLYAIKQQKRIEQLEQAQRTNKEQEARIAALEKVLNQEDLTDFGLNDLISCTLSDALPKAALIRDLDNNINKYVIDKIG